MTIRVLLVDDQALFREGLETLLSVHEDIQVVGQASNGQEALQIATKVQPDVVLMDIRMPILDGVRATHLLKNALPQCRVIVLTTFDDDEYIFDALRTGAVGYLLKDVASAQLVEAIRAAARGESILEPSVAAKVIAEFSRVSRLVPSAQMEHLVDPLSERELEILGQIAKGFSNKEIADQLFIAEGTVKNHVTNILGKLGVRDRTQAALKARELGLL
ncbi:MAG TPA: response regulator transcription factor [Anaerolineae bacterium]|nr:response regulator transcription factor [Anaerolineae bacterium]